MRNVEDYLEKFVTEISILSITDLEELYTRTFDINPIASLEIGWHLFGETYERGAFLVKMRGLLRQYHIEESSELPDHLTQCLMVVGRMPKAEADEFVSTYLRTSLDKILEGFQGKENPYEHLLLALKNFIQQEHIHGVEANV
jgi:nitrate reductase delta subunit